MLDQRRAQEQGYITLKEAAQLANYTPDYVGQLIRAGKIKGEQVYSSVAWVTTKEEVEAYLENKSRTVDTSQQTLRAPTNTKVFSYALIGVIAVAVLLFQYVLYVSLDATIERAQAVQGETLTMHTSS